MKCNTSTLFILALLCFTCRKISTSLAKEWLRQLQIEDVPLLVCLTHADRLYAECMKKDQDPNPNESKRQVIGSELQVREWLASLCSFIEEYMHVY